MAFFANMTGALRLLDKECRHVNAVSTISDEPENPLFILVGDQGVEPCASFLSGKRSTDELITQIFSR